LEASPKLKEKKSKHERISLKTQGESERSYKPTVGINNPN